MRIILLTSLVLVTAGCASNPQPRFRHGPPGFRGGRGDGEGRAERGRLFISPMGEPIRAGRDGGDPQDTWFEQADINHDGALSRAEFSADAARFFKVLDRGHDGEIDPDDIDYYERFLCPEVRVAGGGGRGPSDQGMRSNGAGGFSFRSGGTPPREGRQRAARFSYLDYPQPVVVADRNFNRGVDAQEFARAADDRFAILDKNGDGRITHNELPALGVDRPGRPGQPGGPGRRTIGRE